MQHHEIQYWVACPKCGHQVEVKKEVRSLPDIHCDKCNLLFSFTIEEVAAAESIEPD
jgi:transcription elongation factor Elf1